MRVCLLAALVGCGFHANDATNVVVDAPPMFDDAGHELRRIVFDTADNWNDVGAELFDMSVDPWGSITQAGYAYGGIMSHGTTMMLWNPADPDNKMIWDPVATATPVGVGCWDAKDINNGGEVDQFGIAANNAPFSMYLEGEIQLADGVNSLSLSADKVGFIEIAKPHTNVYTQVVVSHNGTKATANYDTTGTGAGWYPFHIGWTRTTGNYGLKLQIAGRNITRTDIRARGDIVRGLMRSVFDHEIMGSSQPIAQVDENDAIQTVFATPPPGAPGTDEWSAHYAGQLYIQTQGDYTFEADTDDGNFVSVAGITGSSHWAYKDPSGLATTTVAVTLGVGWHDVVVDYNQINGPRFATFKVATGPDLAGMNIPKARLRSVEPRGNRLVVAADTQSHTIRDNNGTPGTATATMVGHPTEMPAQLDVLIRLNTGHLDQLVFVLKSPGGQTKTVTPTAGSPNSGDQYLQFSVTDATFLGTVVAGAWSMTVSDAVNGGGDSQLEDAYMTMHATAGLDAIAPSAVWRWTGDLTTSLASIDDVDWTERFPANATPAVIQMRTCDMDKCTDEPAWSDPLAHHAAPALATKRYLQIQVTMPSDGTSETELQQLTIALRRNLN